MTARRMLLVLCAVLPAAAPLSAAEPTKPGQCYALLIGGLPGPEPFNRWYADWLARFQSYLTKSAGVPAANITALSGPAATGEAITGAIAKLAQRVKPEDQLIVFIVGHGEILGPSPTLILPGPDLSAPQLSAALAGIPAKNQIILNFSSSSGDFLKHLAAPGRINLTATSPTELNDPVFAEFFLRGLESNRADTDHKGSISLLKAYNWAAQQTATWIARWKQTGSGDAPPILWKADGKEAVAIFEKLYPNIPGRKLDPTSDRKSEDAAIEIQPPAGQLTEAWVGRRVIDEHAMIEDCGKEIGVAALGENGCQPILGEQANDPGNLAGQVILGHPSP